jgi:hypothetical protein
VAFAALSLASFGCSTARTGDGPGTFRCGGCITDSDCGGDSCIQYASDVACAPLCGPDGACPDGTSCGLASTTTGGQAQVCMPVTPMCGITDGPDATTVLDGGPGNDANMPQTCNGLIGPSSASCCTCRAGQTCATNGCYGGWWCNPAGCTCQAAPASCTQPMDAGMQMQTDAGPLPMGTVTASGGTVSRLSFAVLGDSRPAMPTDSTDPLAGYPTAIVHQLYTDLQGLTPRPQFALVTGDYCFSSTAYHGSTCPTQHQTYLQQRQAFSNTVFYAMGNHECTGGTASNCGPNGTNGNTVNYMSFLSNMMGEIHQTLPYYAIHVNATDGSWTSKFLFTAPNAWDATQDAWLQNELMTDHTTYTFVIYHEPSDVTTPPPGTAPIQTDITSAGGVTMRITGHSHTYYHRRLTNEVTIGLGGAPPAGSYNYGYLTVNQLANGDIEVREFDYMSGTQNDVWRVHPDGSAAP